jgi:hypothetical protein
LRRNRIRLSDFSRLPPLPRSSPARGEGRFLRRVAPEFYDSGVRGEPAMTRGFLRLRPFFRFAGRGTENRCQETGDGNSCGASRRRRWAGEHSSPLRKPPGKTRARRNPFFVLRRVAPGRWQGE